MPVLARALHSVHFHAAQHVTRSGADKPTLAIIIPVVIVGSVCLAFCLWISFAESSPWTRRENPVNAPSSSTSEDSSSISERKPAVIVHS